LISRKFSNQVFQFGRYPGIPEIHKGSTRKDGIRRSENDRRLTINTGYEANFRI